MSPMRFAAIALVASTGFAQPAPPMLAASTAAPANPSATDPLPPAPRATTVEHDGQTFQLAHRTAAKNVETDEYTVAGETIGDWSQLLTVQRLTLPKPARAEEFLAYFQTRVATDGASFEVVKQSPTATVFAVRFPQSDTNDEQVMICLAFLAPDAPARLNVVQYALKPQRSPVAVVAMRIRSWKDKFVRQADALGAPPAQ